MPQYFYINGEGHYHTYDYYKVAKNTQFCSVKLKFNKLDYKRLAKCALTDDLQFRPGFLIEKNKLPD